MPTAAAVQTISREEARQGVPIQRRRRRQRTMRGRDETDKVVLNALTRIRALREEDVFRCGVAEIFEYLDKGLKILPSRAGVYRAIKRMNGTEFKLTRKGDNGHFVYDFEGTAKPAMTTRVDAVADTKFVAQNGNGAHAVVHPMLATLIEEYENVNTDVDRLVAELKARIDAKNSERQALEAALRLQAKVPA